MTSGVLYYYEHRKISLHQFAQRRGTQEVGYAQGHLKPLSNIHTGKEHSSYSGVDIYASSNLKDTIKYRFEE